MQKQKEVWSALAQANNLTFTPARFLHEPARIEGAYRGYQLQLSPWTFGVEIILSALSSDPMSPDNDFSKPKLAPEEINPLLTEPYLSNIVQGYVRATDYGRKFFYHQIADMNSLAYDLKALQQLFELLSSLADDYRHTVALGGTAIPALQTLLAHRLKIPALTWQLLRDIESETLSRLGPRANRLLCPYCKTRFQIQAVDIPGLLDHIELAYCGCRKCHQSQKFHEGRVFAIIDNKMYPEQIIQPDQVWINWLMYYKVFDFDEVHIIHATDEEVERFVMHLGHDTDPIRRPQYRYRPCLISADCVLSENSMRILRRMFGTVDVK